MLFPEKIYQLFTFAFTASLIRYFVIAGIAFFIYYIGFKNKLSYKKIQLKFPKNSDYQREILFSLLTFLIFGLVAVVCFVVGSVTGAGDGGVSLATERVKDAPLSMRSRSVLDPCNFPSSLGSYRPTQTKPLPLAMTSLMASRLMSWRLPSSS